MNNSTSQKPAQILMLDVVRAVAVFLVLKSHWIYFDIEKLGWFKEYFATYSKYETYFLLNNRFIHPGVLIFIVLSGFIIHYTNKTLVTDADSKWSLLFILKRLARIYPIFIVALTAGLVIQHFFYAPLTQYDLTVFLYNAFMIYGLDYIQPPAVNNILVTIQSEFWLYAFYGIIFRFLTNSRRWIGLLMFAFAVWVLNHLINSNEATQSIVNLNYWSKNNSFAYVLYWCIGAYCAEFAKRKSDEAVSWFLPLTLFFITIAIIPLQTSGWSYMANELLISLTVGSLLVKLSDKNFNNTFTRTLGYFGRAGYSIYAFHMCVFMIFMAPVSKVNESWLYAPAMVLLYALVVCFIAYYFIEKPLHLWAKKINLTSVK